MALFYLLLGAFAIIGCSSGERLHEQIYSSIEGGAACFRRLNGTHQVGCSTSDRGSVGVVQMIRTASDAEWMALNGTAGPYTAVVSTSLFQEIVEVLMQHPTNVAGILVYDNATERASSFSEESRCPNEYSSSPSSQCSSANAGGITWNERGTGLMTRDIPFPIFYLPDSQSSEVEKIEDCYNRFNLNRDSAKGQPLCSLQLTFFMFAAVNSEVCMRRSAVTQLLTPTKVCDPLGDFNVYYPLFPRGKEAEDAKKPVDLVTARIDSASLFDGIAPGAASSVIGLVSVLATASLLSKMIPQADAHLHQNNVLFTLFNGESFDYIGSQRVAYDLARGAWPARGALRPGGVRLHAEVGGLGGGLRAAAAGGLRGGAGWDLYAYAPYPAEVPAEITIFLNQVLDNLNKNDLTISPEFSTNLPPSSLHSFRRILRNETESGAFPEILLTDFKDKFSNSFYHSALDDSNNVAFVYRNITVDSSGTFIDTDALIVDGKMNASDTQVKVARFATALTHTLYQRVVGAAYTGALEVSAHLIDEMLYCFLQSQACRLFSAADYMSGDEESPAERPAPLYVGVSANPSAPAVIVGHLLTLLAGDHLDGNKTTCDALKDPDYTYYWLRGWNHTGVCIQTSMNYSQAVSPAFIIPDYDHSSGLYSTWTESVWHPAAARVFVTAGGGGARAAACCGAAATLLAAAATYWLQRQHRRLFAAQSVPVDAAAGILRSVNC